MSSVYVLYLIIS